MDQKDVNVTEIMENATEIMENANDSVEFNGMKIVQVIIASTGVITNIIVIIVFLNDRKLRRKVPNICIINQSLLDCTSSLVLLLSSVTITDFYKVHHTGILGWMECHLWNSELLSFGLFVSSTWNIVILTIERFVSFIKFNRFHNPRYLEIVHPIWHKTHFKKKWLYISFAVIWPFGIILYAAFWIPTSKIVGRHCLCNQPSPMFQGVFRVCIVFIEFLVPLMILIYCYGRILLIIKERIGSNMGGDDTQTAKFELVENNVIKTLFIVVFFFFICFLGIEVLFLFYSLGFEVDWNSSYYNITVIMLFLNCTINPFIYLTNYKDFQKALMRQFCCRISRYDGNSDRTGSTISTSMGPPSNG